MNTEFSLKDFVINLLQHWRLLLISAIIFAAALGGMKFIGGMKGLNESSIADSESSDYIKKSKALKEEIKQLKKSTKQWEELCLNSTLMEVNSYGGEKYTAILRVQLTSNSTDSEFTAKSIATAYANLVNRGELFDNIGVISEDDDITIESLAGIIHAEAKEGLVIISGYPVANVDVADVITKMSEYLRENMRLLKNIDESYQLVIINSGLGVSVDLSEDSISELQSKAITRAEQYRRVLDEREKALENLQQESGGTITLTKGGIVRGTIKYGMAGLFVGLIVGIALVLLFNLLDNKLRDEQELRKGFALACIGNSDLFMKKKKNVIDRWIGRLNGKVYYTLEETEKYDYTVSNISVMLDSDKVYKKILVTGTILEEELSQFYENLKTSSSDTSFELVLGYNINISSDTVKLAKECDAIVLVEKAGYSELKEIAKEYQIIENLERQILGFVMV